MAALPPVLLTVGAVAAEPYFGLGDLKAIGPGHLPEDSVGQGAGGLNDAAAAEADQVQVLGGRPHLVVVVAFVKVKLVHQPLFLEFVQVSVDGG